MLLDDFNHFLQVVVWISVVVEPVGQLFERLEETVQVHLVVVAAANHVLVDDVVVGLHDMTVRQARVLAQPLELGRRDEVVTLLSRQDLEHLLCVGVKIQLVELAVWNWQDLLETAELLDLLQLLVGSGHDLHGVTN